MATRASRRRSGEPRAASTSPCSSSAATHRAGPSTNGGWPKKPARSPRICAACRISRSSARAKTRSSPYSFEQYLRTRDADLAAAVPDDQSGREGDGRDCRSGRRSGGRGAQVRGDRRVQARLDDLARRHRRSPRCGHRPDGLRQPRLRRADEEPDGRLGALQRDARRLHGAEPAGADRHRARPRPGLDGRSLRLSPPLARVSKLVVNGSNDPYWELGAVDFYWKELGGPKALLCVPNAGHDAGSDARSEATLVELVRRVGAGRSMPELSASDVDDGRTAIASDEAPQRVLLWRTESASRDFRSARWRATEARRQGDRFVADVAARIGSLHGVVRGSGVPFGGTLVHPVDAGAHLIAPGGRAPPVSRHRRRIRATRRSAAGRLRSRCRPCPIGRALPGSSHQTARTRARSRPRTSARGGRRLLRASPSTRSSVFRPNGARSPRSISTSTWPRSEKAWRSTGACGTSLPLFDRRLDRVIDEHQEAKAPQEVPTGAEQRGEEVGRVTHRARDVAQGDHVDATRTAAAKLELERHASAGDRAANRAAEIEPSAAAGGVQATTNPAAKPTCEVLGEGDELAASNGSSARKGLARSARRRSRRSTSRRVSAARPVAFGLARRRRRPERLGYGPRGAASPCQALRHGRPLPSRRRRHRASPFAPLAGGRREEPVEHLVERRPVDLVLHDRRGETVAQTLSLDANRRGRAQRIDSFRHRDRYARHPHLVRGTR